MGVIADLMVNVGADIGSFKHGMNQVGKDVDEAGGGFGKFGALAMGAGLAAAGAVTGVVAFGTAAVEHARAAGEEAWVMSQKFGLLPGVASQWLAIADDVGISSESMAKGFQFLSKNVSGMELTLQAGGKISATQGQVYKDLGINVFGAHHKIKDAQTLMLESADAFAKMKNGPEKAALAMKLFGKSGTDLLPMLNQGSAGIKALMADSMSQGEVMSGPQVEAAHKLTLAQRDLNQTISGATTQIGLFLIPAAIALVTAFQAHLLPILKQLGAYFMEHVYPALVQVYAAFMTLVGPAIAYIKTHFDDLKPVLIALAIVFGIVVGVIVVAIGLVVLAVVGLVAGIAWLSNQIRTHADGWAAAVQNFVIGGIVNFQRFVTWVQSIPGRIKDAIGSTATGIWDGIWHSFKSMVNKLINAWNSLHFTIGGGDFAGQHIPSVTLGVTKLPTFHSGGFMPYTGLALLERGEEVLPRTRAGTQGGTVEVHVHIENFLGDGPAIDIMTNKIAQRLSFALGS